MPARASEAARIGGGYGGEDVGGVLSIETIEYLRERRAQRDVWGLRGRRQRDEDDAEIGVLTGRRESRIEGLHSQR
jgi:hypothetical protein